MDETLSAFGGTYRRDKLCENLRRYIDAVKMTGWKCDILIDGSFVMPNVAEPNDIDVILVLSDDWDMARRDFRPFEYNVLDRGHTKRTHKIDVYPVLTGSEQYLFYFGLFTKIRVEWCREFGLPEDSRKGLVRIMP